MPLRDYVVHLRIPFQILLSPIFLWGFLLANGHPGVGLFAAYFAFHIFGYGGGTAFNSYYDSDKGPIGGLAYPPPIPRHLLGFSIIWQGLGLLLAIWVGPPLGLIYLVMFWLSVAYSHRRLRWKGKPLLALGTVAVGQGMLPFLAGWLVGNGGLVLGIPLLGLLATTLFTVGLYPLTQIYQYDEDGRRGDLTFARNLGAAASFRFAIISVFLGGLTAIYVVAVRFSPLEALILAVLVGCLLVWIGRWSRQFAQRSTFENYRACMTTYSATTLPFLAWVLFHLSGR